MADDPNDQHQDTVDLHRILDVIGRRYPQFLTSLILGWSLVWAASWILPAKYKSGTLILVEQPTMPKDYVTPNVNEDLQGRLQNITQQILSRTRLLRIIDQMNLYSGGHIAKNPDEKVEKMRKDIDIELVRDAQDQITAFNVYYSSHDPQVAQQVTGELTKLFINDNLEVRQQQSEDTTKFLEDQLETARQTLTEQEAKVRAFKGDHIGELPSQQASNLQILSGVQAQLQNEEDALNTAQQQQVYLQSLITQYHSMQGSTRAPDGSPTGLAAIDQDLDQLKAKLADLSSHYTDQYPDIRNLKLQIAKTEALRSQVAAAVRSRPTDSSHPSTEDRLPADPLQSSALLQLEGQLKANQAEIKNRQRAISELKGKVGDYQARLNQEPVSEQHLADLTRGYDQSKANYDDLLKKESESRMATSMEQMQQGQRFRMIDPPSLPLKPDFPNRLKFCGMGLGFGLALGVLVAGGLEFMDDRLHTEKQLKTILPMKILCEIPEVLTQTELQLKHKRAVLGWVMTALIFATILAGSAISYRHG